MGSWGHGQGWSVRAGTLRLFAGLFDAAFLSAPVLAGAVERAVEEALGALALEVLAGGHQGRVIHQGVEQLPVASGAPRTRHLVLLLLLLDQLDTWEKATHPRHMTSD